MTDMMRRLTLSALLVLLGCESTSRPPPPTKVQPLERTAPFVQLLRAAPLVVHAKVERVTGRDGTVGKAQVPAIFSDLSLRVLGHASRGEPPETLTLTVLGGQVGDRAHWVSESVRLSEGDEVLAFVDPQASPHPFIGETTGVFRVIDRAVFAFDGRAVLEVGPDGLLLAQPAPPAGRLPVGQGTATGFAEEHTGPALPIDTVLATLARLRDS